MIRTKIRSHFGRMHFGFRYRYKGEGKDAGFLVSLASQDADAQTRPGIGLAVVCQRDER